MGFWVRVELPWPPSKLSRNGSQGDWRGKAAAAKQYRRDCVIALKTARGKVVAQDGQPIMLVLKYHAPDKRRRDLDNLLAMTKQGIDAISEGLGIDDSRFEFTLKRGEPCKPSKVVVTI